ncbi:hypothetical protein [Salinisphaera hydrothermalis]|uniref:hypothetical protein n=1 Tax=Salinisphaera hydrothermalis TaxID=563188 RepID=UPI0033422BC0
MNARDDDRLMHLPVAAERCVSRIERYGLSPTTLEDRLGANWKRRFYTVEVFFRGIIERPRAMPDAQTRRTFISHMKTCLPPGIPDIDIMRRQFGVKIAVASLCYKKDADRAAEVLLYDLRRVRNRVARIFGR